MHATNVWCPEMIVVGTCAIDRHAVTHGELRRFRIATERRVDARQPKNDHVVARVDDDEAHAYAAWAGKRIATTEERALLGADAGLYCASAAQLDREQMVERIASPQAARAFVEQRLRALPRTCFVGLEAPSPPGHSFAAYTATWAIGADPDLLDRDGFYAHVLLLDGRDATLHLVHGYGSGGQLVNARLPALRGVQSEVYALHNVIASLRPLHEVLLARMAQLPAVRWNAS